MEVRKLLPIVSGVHSIIILSVAIGTDHWIYTKEPNSYYNHLSLNAAYDAYFENSMPEFDTEKWDHIPILNFQIGLWRMCIYSTDDGK